MTHEQINNWINELEEEVDRIKEAHQLGSMDGEEEEKELEDIWKKKEELHKWKRYKEENNG